MAALACGTSAGNDTYFGKTVPPAGQVLRYVTGSEPESLDTQVSTGQPEGRIYMALFEGLVEYDPRTSQPIPAIATRWESNHDNSEFVFHLRQNARFSNGEPIRAQDFVYTFRRGVSPELAVRNANLAYYIKYARAYNEGGAFVRDRSTGEFLLADTPGKLSTDAGGAGGDAVNGVADTPFHDMVHGPERLVVPLEPEARNKILGADPKLKDIVDRGELVPVRADDIGVEAVDDFTLRITLTQSAPFFVGLMANQFFRVVPRGVIEKWGNERWTDPEHIVTSGPFKLESWKPYQELTVTRDPMYWDAASVRLEKIIFYPLEDNPTIMNLYKAGDVDAVLNHTVPSAWYDRIARLRDYMDAPEDANEYYSINILRAPMNDRRVRKAFNMAINKASLAEWRRTARALTGFVPDGIFPGYPIVKGDNFDPAGARQLLADAGYRDGAGNYDPKRFPVNEVEITYNTQESNKAVAEFVQEQWKQNLGLTVAIKSMEWKTFLTFRGNVEYKGFARNAWSGDYMDPFSFLNLFATNGGDNCTGWWDQRYVNMLDEANRMLDEKRRFEHLAAAEAYLLDVQPVIPLYVPKVNWVKKPYVIGMYPNPVSMYPWKFVHIEHDSSKWGPESLENRAD